MLYIQSKCIEMQKYIKKSKLNLYLFMYVPTDSISLVLLNPFVSRHEEYFNKVCEYVVLLNHLCKEKNINIVIEDFLEFEDDTIVYDREKIVLTKKEQYESRLIYLNYLYDKIVRLSFIIKGDLNNGLCCWRQPLPPY